MFRTATFVAAGLAIVLPVAASAQGGQMMSDRAYCVALGVQYERYVGPSYQSSRRGQPTPNAEVDYAKTQCTQGNVAAAIPFLERKLADAKVPLPGRSGEYRTY